MDSLHREILFQLRKRSGRRNKLSKNSNYFGSQHPSYNISSPVQLKIARGFIKEHPNISYKALLELLGSLFAGKSHDEKFIAGLLLKHFKDYRRHVNPNLLNRWLNHLEGWGEVDSLCQSIFTAEEMLYNWTDWKRLILSLKNSKNINKQRASLVLLIMPVSKSTDRRLSKAAFQNINHLKDKEEILITKSISWLLRSLIKNHRKDVQLYLKHNASSLPRVAIRETQNKLTSSTWKRRR